MDRAIRRIGEPGAVVDLQIRRILTDDEGKRAVQRAVFFQDKKLFVTDSVVNQLLRRKMREKNSIVGTSSAARNAER